MISQDKNNIHMIKARQKQKSCLSFQSAESRSKMRKIANKLVEAEKSCPSRP
jgi:hypothetical protein